MNITLAILAAGCQLINAWMGWKVTGQTLSVKQRKTYDALFIIVGLAGLVLVGLIAARAGRQERAHFSARIVNTYQVFDQTTRAIVPFSWFVVDKPLAFNVFAKNVGNGSAYNAEEHFHSFVKPDNSASSESDVVKDFKSWLLVQPHNSRTWPKDSESFSTAAGDVISPEDYSNLTTGRRTVFVIGNLTFDDDFGSHEFDVCQVIQKQMELPPDFLPGFNKVTVPTEIWGFCSIFNGEK